MKIQIQSKGHSFPICIPNGLVFNRFVMKMILKSSHGTLTPEAANRLIREFRQLAQREKPWELVHVESKDGEVVSITI